LEYHLDILLTVLSGLQLTFANAGLAPLILVVAAIIDTVVIAITKS
jgi:hypothetical protein